jgi:hypothetical protein
MQVTLAREATLGSSLQLLALDRPIAKRQRRLQKHQPNDTEEQPARKETTA